MATLVTTPVLEPPKLNSPLEPPREPQQQPPRPLLKAYESFLIPVLALFALGNALAYVLPEMPFARPTVALPLMMVLLGLVCVAAGQPEHAWRVRLSLWLVVLLGGMLNYDTRHFVPGADDIGRQAPLMRAEISGTVESTAVRNRLIVQVSELNKRKISGKVLVYLPPETEPLAAGTRLLITGELKKPFRGSIPGAFDQESYLAGQHITAVLKKPWRIIALETSMQPHFVLQRITDDIKNQVAGVFSRSLPSPQSQLLGGIVLGDKAIPVDPETRKAFTDTGLVHILAASGMNVGIIAGAAFWLMTLLKLPFRLKIGITMLAVAFYSLLTGLPPSIQRAAAMLELALLLKLLNRELSSVFLLGVATVLLITLNPDTITSIGFQFSVLTTFGLLAMVPPLQDKLGYYTTRWLAGLLLVPMVAQLWIWPLSVYYFNQFPLHTVPLNILALALIGPLTVLGFSAGLISLVSPLLGEWIGMLARPFLDLLLLLVHWGNGMHWAKWQMASPPGWLIGLCYVQLLVILGLLYRWQSRSLRQKAVLGLLPLALSLGLLTFSQVQARQDNAIDILPLSFKRYAYLIYPASTRSVLAVVPPELSYFEGRALADYFRHRHITRLQGIIPFGSAPEAEEQEASSAGWKAAFSHVTVDSLFHASGTLPAWIREVSENAHVKRFPASGGQLALGDLRLYSTPDGVRLQTSKTCLLEVSARYEAHSECSIQSVRTSTESRIYLENERLDDDAYHLVQHGNSLQLFTHW